MIERHLDIVVASLTRNRPRMLKALIESWASMQAVMHTTVRFLVIENDADEKSLEIVEGLRERFPELHLDYVLEPRPGIPVARNRALDEARGAGADILCFVDDDEEVAPDWLVDIVSTYRATGASAVGGPVFPKRPNQRLDAAEECIFRAVEARSEKRYRKIAGSMKRGKTRHVTVSTGNCLYNLSFVVQNNLRFDDTLVWSGGEDAKLSAEIVKAGGKLAWSETAIVWETQPPSRLSASYVLSTARDREATYLRRRIEENRTFVLAAVALVLLRLIAHFILLPTGLFGGGSNYIRLVNAGSLLAFAYVFYDKNPAPYKDVTGY